MAVRSSAIGPVVSLLAALAAAGLLAACIVSVDGLTGGDAGGGGALCDGACDAASDQRARDAGDGGDATDATLGGDTADSAALGDTGGDATVACMVPTPDAALLADPSCGFVDGGGCAPSPVNPALVHWTPTRAAKNACTTAQVQTYITDCAGGGNGQCGTFETASATAACYACMHSFSTDPTYGAIIDTSVASFANVGGCIATLEPCNMACGMAFLFEEQCQLASCDPVCPATVDGGAALSACWEAASVGCPCAQFQQTLTQCSQEILARSSPAAVCLGGNSFNDIALTVGTALCAANVADQ